MKNMDQKKLRIRDFSWSINSPETSESCIYLREKWIKYIIYLYAFVLSFLKILDCRKHLWKHLKLIFSTYNSVQNI